MSAPDMFETLHWIAEHVKEFGDIEDNETMLALIVQRAKEAIKKAKRG